MDVQPPESGPAGEPQLPAGPGKTSTGLEPNIAAGLSVVLGWIGGLIFFLIEKDSRFVRFYALQSMVLFGLYLGACILSVILAVVGAATHLPLTSILAPGLSARCSPCSGSSLP